MLLVFSLLSVASASQECYWNSECPYSLYSSKTPYDTVRGDLRDYQVPNNCEAVSVWTLNRHGNRNPGKSVTVSVKEIADLKDEIINSYNAGNSQLCAQDIEEFKKWTWNETLEISQSFLTGTGYEELYDIGKRIREKYPHLVEGSSNDFYFRPTNEQRTITSAVAFVHGLTDGTSLNVSIDEVQERDDVIRPYENCDRYQEKVKGGTSLEEHLDAYYKTTEFVAVQNAVQRKLGIPSRLSPDDIYSFYEICRFYRSWTQNLKSPWCAVFSDEDLAVLEYRDDVRHYHRNGYGSWVNVNLGHLPMKNLYESFEAAVEGRGKKITSYFSHDTMMEMVWCALGIYKDDFELQGGRRELNRLWRTSYIGAFSVNLIAVLNKCTVSGTQSYRVQLFINEKATELCPLEGCTWQQFQQKFQPFASANLEFCSLDYRVPETNAAPGGWNSFSWALLLQTVLLLIWKFYY